MTVVLKKKKKMSSRHLNEKQLKMYHLGMFKPKLENCHTIAFYQ